MPEHRLDRLLLILTYFCYFKTDLMKFSKCVFPEIFTNLGKNILFICWTGFECAYCMTLYQYIRYYLNVLFKYIYTFVLETLLAPFKTFTQHISFCVFPVFQAAGILNSMDHHALRATSPEGSMCSAAAPLLWLSASQTAVGGASVSPADATSGLRQRSPQLRTPEEESP